MEHWPKLSFSQVSKVINKTIKKKLDKKKLYKKKIRLTFWFYSSLPEFTRFYSSLPS